ncbi:uncharacterized protein [Centruroides vittatus]|uniref:uncharacterized protein n=1 Tax=Centruroides vittatus TaxID=120091 RepID=UPI00350F251F
MKIIVAVALFCISFDTISALSSMTELCAKPTKWIEIYWKCSLRKLPNYYKNLYTNIANCVYDLFGIDSKGKGIMFYLCGNSAVKSKVIACVKTKPKADKFTIKWENKQSEKVFQSCTNRAYEVTYDE